MQSSVIKPEFAFVDSPEISSLKRSYISRSDLIEVLTDYYHGVLDNPPSNSVICMDLLEWHSNTLWCVVDSQQIDRILLKFKPYQKELLKLMITNNCNDDVIVSYYTTSYKGNDSYIRFTENEGYKAFDLLSDLLLEDLDDY